MKNQELQEYLRRFPDDVQVVVQIPHCCGSGGDFEALESEAVKLIPDEGMRRSHFSPMAMAYSGLEPPVDERQFIGCIVIGAPGETS